MKKIFWLLTFIVWLWGLRVASPVYSAGEFSADYNVLYEVFETGRTTVSKNIRLTNLTTNYYASEYTLSSETKIENIQAFDRQGPLKIDLKTDKEKTDIHLIFNEKVVGLGKILNFTLKYESPEIASHNGRIWEINIPQFKEEEDVSSYNVSLKVPGTFGPLAYSSPQPRRDLFWIKEDFGKKGINLAFGDYQIFDFKLGYHLKNPNLFPVQTEIPLPPETSYQKINLYSLEPLPFDVKVDKDGNWLAQYRLSPGQKIDIMAGGSAQIFFRPRPDFKNEPEDKKDYLLPQKFWESENPSIINLAKTLATPQAIYDFVVSTLDYDYERINKNIPRQGAVGALENPNLSICMEFTDLFIALARAVGIPARELDGFAYTTNSRLRPLSLKKDILHSWAEYFDEEKKTWVMVDPTWGKTAEGDYFNKLDFNHFVFVIKGQDSQRPYPAGSYKTDNEGKDVEVTFGKGEWKDEKGKLEVQFNFPSQTLAGFPLRGSILIENKGPGFFSDLSFPVSSSFLSFSDNYFKLGDFPPFARRTIPLSSSSTAFKSYFTDTIKIKIDEQLFIQEIKVIPFFFLNLVIGGGVLGGILLFFISLKAGGLLIQKLHR